MMGVHRYQRVGFREIYEYDGADDWYEERCNLFRYRTVNCAFSVSRGVNIERRHRRCFRCAYYPICFRLEIMREKLGSGKIPNDIYWILEELNTDERETWRN